MILRFFLILSYSWIGMATLGAQAYSLQARVNDFPGNRAYLVQFKSDKQVIIDSVSCLDGAFSFQFSEKTSPGVYRILLGEKGSSNLFEEDPQFFDFIFNLENINLRTSIFALVDSMNVLQSRENDIFYRFQSAFDLYQLKLSRITPLFSLYSEEDAFFSPLNQEFVSLQNTFNQLSLSLSGELPGSIASSVIAASMVPVIEKAAPANVIRAFVRDHFFDLKNISDKRLLNSPFINKTILDYLGLYSDNTFDQSQQEDNFILAIDGVMDAVSTDPVIYDYVLNFLVDGFQRFQMEKVLVHIAENYIEKGCETDSKKLLQKRLEGYEKMAPGKKAPDILMLDQNGKQVRLYDLDHNYSLVVFWASWCPHCNTFLKQLAKWYPEKTIDLEVYAVSIDTSKFAWEEALLMHDLPWINTLSGSGWDGKAPKDYNVYATPTLFLINRDHVIVSKPMTFREFKKEVEALEVMKN